MAPSLELAAVLPQAGFISNWGRRRLIMTPKLTTPLLPHLTKLEYGSLIVWFSYQTPIAFRTSRIMVVRQNEWSITTARHISSLDSGNVEGRIPGPEFEARLQQVWPPPTV